MKYLITGGAGFIGINLVKKLGTDQVVIIDKGGVGSDIDYLVNIGFDVRHVDLLDYGRVDEIYNEIKPEYVIHMAAESHVDRSIESPKDFIESNILGTFSILEAIAKSDHKPTKFAYVSTDEVYGSLGKKDEKFIESLKHNPSSVYSATKSAAESLVLAYFHTHKIEVVITNCTNNYGPHQNEEKFIPKTIKSMLLGEDVIVYGKGDNIRDWMHVDDHNSALIKSLGGVSGNNYNLGSNNELSNKDLLDKITEIVYSDNMVNYIKDNYGYELPERKVLHVEDRKGHDFRYAINNSKFKKEMLWEPKVNFNEAMIDTVKWYVDKFLKSKSRI